MSLLCTLALLAPPVNPPAVQETLIDINLTVPTVPTDSSPSDFARLGGNVFFAADVPGLGRELCIFDGTTAQLFVDIRPGSQSGGVQNLGTVGNYVYFSAYAEDVGEELWRTDGTVAGTKFIAELVPNPNQPGWPGNFVQLGSSDEVIFTGRTPTFGRGVWKTDGTAAGTIPLVSFGDGQPYNYGYYAVELTPVGDLVFFTTYLAGGLWRTDGTVAGTYEVTPQHITVQNDLVAVGPHVYFVGSSYIDDGVALWRSNGVTVEAMAAPLGTQPSYPVELEEFGGELYFSARYSGFDRALFKNDGTPGNLVQVATPPSGSVILDLTGAQSFLTFTVDEPATGQELWKTNGTPASSQLIQELVPGPDEFQTDLFTAVGDRVVFQAFGATGAEPYATDGVVVEQLADLKTGGPSLPDEFWVDGGSLWFAATADGVGREIFSTDGTPAGTQLVADVAPTPTTDDSEPRDFVRIGQKVFFTADDGIHGREVWVSDGTAAGTHLLVDALPGPDSSEPEDLVALGDQLFFIATEQDLLLTDDIEVWVSDGTPAGTAPFTDLLSLGFYYPRDLVAAGDHIFFSANDLNVYGWEPFASDGTPGNVVSLGNLNPNVFSKDSDAEGFTAVGDYVFFRAIDENFDHRTWRTDGTPSGTVVQDFFSAMPALSPYYITPVSDELAICRAFGVGVSSEPWAITPAGTTLLADIAPGTAPSNPSDFTVLGDKVLFTAESPDLGEEVWVTDGTPAGTNVLLETVVGPQDGDPLILGVAGGKVLFRARDSISYDLWATDGTAAGTVEILDVPDEFFAQGVLGATAQTADFVYFSLVPQFGVSEAWRSDGTAAGTVRLDTVETGFAVGFAEPIGQGNEILTAGASADGNELWRSRGTVATTSLVADIADGAPSSNPQDFIRAGAHVLFRATTHDTGSELYSVPFAVTDGHVLEPYGVACEGTGGLAPRIGAEGAARLGESVDVVVTDAFGPSTAFLFLAFGSAAAPLGDCIQYPVDPAFLFAVTATDAGGEGSVDVSLPVELVALTNVPIYFQYAVVDPGGGFGGAIALTDALEVIIGPAE